MRLFRLFGIAAPLFLLSSRLALAAALFGAEFTMTNSTLTGAGARAFQERGHAVVLLPEAIEAQKMLLAELTRDCLPVNKCVVEEVRAMYGGTSFRVSFPEQGGFWVQLSTDPSVVEIQTKPSTAEEFTQAKPILDDLFQAGKRVGIQPAESGTGMGHIHLDFRRAFGEDANLFRNFLVDFANHQELGGEGVLGGDHSNSPHLIELDAEQKLQFKKVIEEFDHGWIKDGWALAEAINRRVYYMNPAKWAPTDKYQALNLTRMMRKAPDATIELRALHPQRTPGEFLDQLRLFESRIEFLRKLGPEKLHLQDLDKALSARERVAAFRSYVEESGLDWETYRKQVRHGSYEAKASITPLSRNQAREPVPESLRAPAIQGLCERYFLRWLR